MTFQELFRLFYTKYRGEENPPSSTDPEWEIAVSNYNSAVDRLENYDDTRWKFAMSTLQTDTEIGIDKTLTTGDTSFICPSNMLSPGGLYWKIDTNGNRGYAKHVVDLNDVAALNQSSDYGYFLGDQYNGFTFYLNPAVQASENGYGLDYNYYKKLARLDASTEDGTSVIAPGTSEYFACAMAAQRFLDSRNFPAYQIMFRNSEEALKLMKLKNDSGDKYNVPQVQDSGPGWGY